MNTKSKLAEEITKALINDERTQNSAIEVLDNNGVITLKGTAVSDEARAAAAEIASNQEGVVSVIADLEVADHDAAGEIPPIAPYQSTNPQ